MKIQTTYVRTKTITISLVGFDSNDLTCHKLQQILEAKKFQKSQSNSWERTEFIAGIKSESFEFWLSEAKKLCQRFGNGELVEVERGSSESKSGEGEQGSVERNLSSISSYTSPSSHTVEQLLEKVRYLEEEVAQLKKFDKSATEKLRRLKKS